MCTFLVDSNDNSTILTLQWQITTQCDQYCKHCYLLDSNWKCNDLSFEDCKNIFNDFLSTLSSSSKLGAIFLTGGDPLLRKDIFDILKIMKDNDKIIFLGMMGNPYHINSENIKKLSAHNVSIYQISLDGMRKTHDLIRKPGSFDDSVRAFKLLKNSEISPTTMFTISQLNKHELIDVINLSAELGLAAFDFDRLVPSGNGADLLQYMIEPNEYKELLLRAKEEYEKLRKTGCKTQFGFKDNLWELLITEDDLLSSNSALLPTGTKIKHGCVIGDAGFVVEADGNVLGCSKLPISLGKLPEQNISDIFLNSPVLSQLRNFEKIESCKDCEKFDNCKGCRSVAYSTSNGDYFSKDPQCWL